MPKHAIQTVWSLSKFHTTAILKEVFAKHNIEVGEEIVQELCNIVFEKNPIRVTTSEKVTLSTDYRRNRYCREHFSIIEPTELLYDWTSRKAFFYVSVNLVIELVMNRVEFLEKLVFSQACTPGYFKLFKMVTTLCKINFLENRRCLLHYYRWF